MVLTTGDSGGGMLPHRRRHPGPNAPSVTHDQEEALSLSDRVVVMSEGRIEQIGSPADMDNFPTTQFVASFVGTLNLLSARVINASDGRLAVAGGTRRVDRDLESDALAAAEALL
jgi:putative spermidine/putrescine transport system ATP-binding protein